MRALSVISEEHRNLWRIAAALDAVATEVEGGEGKAVPVAFFAAVFDYIDQFMDRYHHAKEDRLLFPAVRRRDGERDGEEGAVAAIIDRLEAEHANGPAALAGLRGRLAAIGADGRAEDVTDFLAALRVFTEVLRGHIRTEEKDLLPRARTLLTAEDWAAIDAAFDDHADPMFGDVVRSEFREALHRIVGLAPESVGLGATPAAAAAPSASGSADILLKVEGLVAGYGRIKALKGIDLEVRRGETVALVGANGAGKTTFLRTLSGIHPASGGSIVFDGEAIHKLRADERVRRGICQSPEGRQVFGPLSIEDNLRLGAYTQPAARLAGDLERVYAMFPVLKEKRALPAGTLSGGQQQMLAIGRALMGRPRLLLLDEPSMGLAPLLVEEVFNVIRDLKAEGMTILLVEQNAFGALAIADRGYVLETGEVKLTGTGRALIDDDEVRSAYLGM